VVGGAGGVGGRGEAADQVGERAAPGLAIVEESNGRRQWSAELAEEREGEGAPRVGNRLVRRGCAQRPERALAASLEKEEIRPGSLRGVSGDELAAEERNRDRPEPARQDQDA